MNEFEKPKKGKLIKKIGMIAGLGIAAVSGTVKYGGKIVDQVQNAASAENNIETHESIGIIVKKLNTSAKSYANFPARGLGPILAKMGNTSEIWNVEIKVDGRNLITPVSKQQFDSLVEGQGYSIVYNTTKNNPHGWVDSIQMTNVEKIKY